MRKHLRYLILLLILLFVAVNESLNRLRSTAWDHPLVVQLYAVSGDERAATSRYIDDLRGDDFEAIETFVNREARRYGVTINAIEIEYLGRLQSHPPQPPSGRSVLENIWWSLRFRAWSTWRSLTGDSGGGDIELFISYYDTETTQTLRHSVGLQRGLIGIINAFADRAYSGSNRVVITHELMHTLGATDKYAAGNLPAYPAGYAEPYRQPRYPQLRAEIMGGRIPLSPLQARMPESLDEVVVGPGDRLRDQLARALTSDPAKLVTGRRSAIRCHAGRRSLRRPRRRGAVPGTRPVLLADPRASDAPAVLSPRRFAIETPDRESRSACADPVAVHRQQSLRVRRAPPDDGNRADRGWPAGRISP